MNSKPIVTMPKPRTSSVSDWDLSSLNYASPESPPPICSSSDSATSLSSVAPSMNSFKFAPRFPANFSSSSTPRYPGMSLTAWNRKEDSRTEDDDSSFHANRFDHLSLSDIQENYLQEMNSNYVKEYRVQPRMSQSLRTEMESAESPRHNLMTRPKPYSAYLDDVKKQGFEADVESWKKAQEEAIMARLNRKEALIGEWEYRQASKATEEMKKIEKKLEKKRARALEKLQKSLNTIKAEANKKAMKTRQEAKDKMSQVSRLSIKARATNSLACLKL